MVNNRICKSTTQENGNMVPKEVQTNSMPSHTFKIPTSNLTGKIYSHLEKQTIIAPGQKGGKKDYYEYMD